jgi:hypothetical protein
MTQIGNQRKIVFLVLLVIVGLPFLGVLALFVSKHTALRSQLIQQNMMGDSAAGSSGTMGYAGGVAVAPDQTTDEYQSSTAMPAKRIGGFESSTIQIAPMPPEIDSGFVPGNDRVVVKNANLSLIVDDVRQTVDKVSTLAKNQEGIVTGSNVFESGSKGGLQAYLTLRVPVTKLDETLTQLRNLAAKVTQDSLSADDRTKQKVDMEARLNNLKASEAQLLTIMKQAKTVQETLEVQRELTNVRSQIEVMTAELQNLSNDAAMSTIQVTLSSKDADLPTISNEQNSIWDEITISLKDMVRLYRQLFILGLRTFILLLPIIVIGAIAWFAWKRKARKS